MRLNQYLAHCGIGARRKADEHISAGRVCVNGVLETRMGVRIMAEDVVTFEHRPLRLERYKYMLLNKPKGCLTTRSDPQGRRTIYDLLPAEAVALSPVGRLDRQSTGLLLLTNDGVLAQRLAHPSYELKKRYRLVLNAPLLPKDEQRLRSKAVVLEDGEVQLDEISLEDKQPHKVCVKLHSGRNRVLRRLFAALGYEVLRLDRDAYGPMTKRKLPQGKWRMLNSQEVLALKATATEAQQMPIGRFPQNTSQP